MSHETMTNPSLPGAHRHTPAETFHYLNCTKGSPCVLDVGTTGIPFSLMLLLIRKPHLGRWKSSLRSHRSPHPQHSIGKTSGIRLHGCGWLSLGAWMEQCFHRCYQTVNYYSCSNQSSIKGISVTHSNFPSHLYFLQNLNTAWSWKLGSQD